MFPNGSIITLVVILMATPAALLFDLWMYKRYGNPATISATLLRWANRFRLFMIQIAFSTGVLFGHLFCPQHPEETAAMLAVFAPPTAKELEHGRPDQPQQR